MEPYCTVCHMKTVTLPLIYGRVKAERTLSLLTWESFKDLFQAEQLVSRNQQLIKNSYIFLFFKRVITFS